MTDSNPWTCPYDGQVHTYFFGRPHDSECFKTRAVSLAKAVRAFRVGALFPHKYSSERIPEKRMGQRGYEETVYLSSAPGGVVEVRVLAGPSYSRKAEVVAHIPPEGTEAAEFTASTLPRLALEMATGGPSGGTDLVLAGQATGLDTKPRAAIEQRHLDLQEALGKLAVMKRKMEDEVSALTAELQRRMDQIWMIELFLGSKEEVKQIMIGAPAPQDTPITLHQRTLCMDEEIAVHNWLHNPSLIGEFDYRDLDAFDLWLVSDPKRLQAVLPEPKGIVALRVRRKMKEHEVSCLADAFAAIQEDTANSMTYLLVRNGGNLYRLWVDAKFWPRFIPRRNEFDFESDIHSLGNEREIRASFQHYLAGALVVQGLIERSDLLHPLPVEGLNIFDTEHTARYFHFLRDDETDLALTDENNPLTKLTWRSYEKWMNSKLGDGVRVTYIGGKTRATSKHRSALEERTGLGTVNAWPEPGVFYTLETTGNSWMGPYRFMYRPLDRWVDGDLRERKRAVPFYCYSDEVVPFDFLSWRVLRHMLLDRGQRAEYASAFRFIFSWYKTKKAEREQERPFVDLVIRTAFPDQQVILEDERARAERLLRWWKIKTKEHRGLKEDEAKALRMVSEAYRRGDDFEDDPERALFATL